jgi:hypothetical protein
LTWRSDIPAKETVHTGCTDDGETFHYEKGDFSWREPTVETAAHGKIKTSISPAEAGKSEPVGCVQWTEISKSSCCAGNRPNFGK